jgi:hypothetical protein
MMAELTCTRCSRALSLDDVVESDAVGVAHIDCRRPRGLTHGARSLLYGYCWAHPIACPACGQSFRLFELDSDPVEYHKRTGRPRCQADLIESVRDHPYTCPLSPKVLRGRVRETREAPRPAEKRLLSLPKTRPRTLRPYHYLRVAEQDRDNPHLVRELVRCGKPSCSWPRT